MSEQNILSKEAQEGLDDYQNFIKEGCETYLLVLKKIRFCKNEYLHNSRCCHVNSMMV
jgi:hypothetical protein